MPIKTNAPKLITDIKARLKKKTQPNPVQLKRIGLLLELQIKKNVRRPPGGGRDLIETGALFNSIRHQVARSRNSATIRAGSYGIPYAAIHEFGADNQMVNVKAHERTIGGAPFPVRAHTRLINVAARPYIRPAVGQLRSRIIEILGGER